MSQSNREEGMLIISHDVVGRQMAGPGIRYYHLASVLSGDFNVTLAVPHEQVPDLPGVGFKIGLYKRGDWESIKRLVEESSVVILPSDIVTDFPQLAQSEAPLVIDGYDPLLAEWLFLHQSLPMEEQYSHWQRRMRELNQQYLMGDFFICASERQRDWWLGLLEANGRINPYTLSQDNSLRSLIDVVAFGHPATPPQKTKQVIRSVWPGINEADKVLLWGGGLWPWLDPLTAIRAAAKVWKHRQDIRLIFPGTRHPNPMLGNIPSHNKVAMQLAKELDLLDKAVFFGDWVPYADWANVLLESDFALSLHYDTLETRLAFRSRMLEYIWGGLPVVATKGDATSDLVTKYGIGIVVDYEDVDHVADAILHLLSTTREEFKVQFERARQDLTWEKAAEPLSKFCRHPRRAPDRVAMKGNLGNPFYMHRRSDKFIIRWLKQVKRSIRL